MNDLTTFTNPEFGQVRTVEIDGTPWLVGKDVAVALGYKNPSNAILKHVDDEDKRLEVLPQGADTQNGDVPPASDVVVKHDTPSGSTKTALINESGLYSLILSSKMPKAKAFKHWVTSEVLPAIRRDGVYQSVKNQQELEEAIARNANIQTAIDRVIDARKELDESTAFLEKCRKGREESKAKYMQIKALCGQVKAVYSKDCNTVRTMEETVRISQHNLTSAIDSLTIVAKGYPFYAALMDSLLDGLVAEKKEE